MSPRRWLTLFAALVAAAFLRSAGADPEQEKQLRELTQRITKLQESMLRDTRMRDETRDALLRIERDISAQKTRLSELRAERATLDTELKTLRAQKQALDVALASDKSRLASEVRTAFVNGRQEHIKLLLNQSDPAEFGRMSVYYRLFSEQRAAQIDRVIRNLEALAATTQKIEGKVSLLEALEQKRRKDLAALESSRQERSALINQIDRQLKASGSEIETLEKEQARLEGLIAELQELLKAFPVASRDPFPKLKGRLEWPVKGRLVADFGQPRASENAKWTGVLIRAERGHNVRAIARGRVAYARWLRGLGLLTVLEHSDGYISLYGHNETLTHQVGEWVDAGEVLATVGDSGGQPETALYFEIRRGRTPLNPHSWFKSGVSSR
jgi:septal ring factor EnvC (AmiA/AmiB activator)